MIGARLKQARLLAGMTQKELASALGEKGLKITAAAISKYEKEKSFPTAQFMFLASGVLNVPGSYFLHQPATSVKWTAFRRHSKLGKKEQEVIQQQAADLAELHVELYSVLYPHRVPVLPTAVPVKTFADAEAVANSLRDMWELDSRPLDNLVQTSEDKGVVVIGWDKSEHFDGLSGWCDKFPVVVIHTGKSADRTRFSLAHEIGHLLMDTSAVSQKMEEKLAHRFAAALLVPAEHARDELGPTRNGIDWGELKMLKRKYGLSMAAWLVRARDLDIISKSSFEAMYKEFGWMGWRTEEPEEYRGDEEPIQLKQMASRAVAEGMVSIDRMTRIGVDMWEPERKQPESKHLTVYDLLAMPEDERKAVMAQAFELAAKEDFEVFEAYELYDDYDEEFDGKTYSASN
jgi:Zn-dependent peptidase ImmA (M78 family)/transcriptional regulator with XRE-family HTH domain